MNMTTFLKTVFPIAITVCFFTNSFAGINSKTKHVLHVMKSVKLVELMNDLTYIKEKSKINIDDNLASVEMEMLGYNSLGRMTYQLNIEDDKIPHASILKKGCLSYGMAFTWKGDRIIKVNFEGRSGTYELVYSNKGTLILITEGLWSKTGKTWIKKSYSLGYNDLDKLTSIIQEKIIGKGSNSLDVSRVKSKIEYKKLFIYQSTFVADIVLKKYSSKKNVVESSSRLSIRLRKGGNIVLTKTYNKEKIGRKNVSYSNNNISELRETSLPKGSYTVYQYTYDEYSSLIKSIEKRFTNTEQLTYHTESLSTFKSGSIENCNLKYDTVKTTYDINGKAIKELTSDQVRTRLENGEWGPWKTLTYD